MQKGLILFVEFEKVFDFGGTLCKYKYGKSKIVRCSFLIYFIHQLITYKYEHQQ